MSELYQLSVSISHETRKRLDRLSKTQGIRKNHIVDKALSIYLDSMENQQKNQRLMPVMLTVSQHQRLHELLDEPATKPTQALRDYIASAKDLGSPNVEEFLAHDQSDQL